MLEQVYLHSQTWIEAFREQQSRRKKWYKTGKNWFVRPFGFDVNPIKLHYVKVWRTCTLSYTLKYIAVSGSEVGMVFRRSLLLISNWRGNLNFNKFSNIGCDFLKLSSAWKLETSEHTNMLSFELYYFVLWKRRYFLFILTLMEFFFRIWSFFLNG